MALSFLAVPAMALRYPAGASPAEPACASLVPEAQSDLAAHGWPGRAARWAAIRRIWTQAKPVLEAAVTRTNAAGVTLPSDELHSTAATLRQALKYGENDLALSMLPLWSATLDRFVQTKRIPYHYPNRAQRNVTMDVDRPRWIAVARDGQEIELYSAIFLADAMDVTSALAAVPDKQRLAAATEFATRAARIASDIYLRWSFGPPPMWQVVGWGCGAGGLNFADFIQQRKDGSLGNGLHPWCRAPWSYDLLIATGIANLLIAHTRDPVVAQLSDADAQRLRQILAALASYFRTRFVPGKVADADGKLVPTVDFDPGVWTDFEDFIQAGHESSDFPDGPASPKRGVGWDVSHGWRIVWMLDLFSAHAAEIGFSGDWRSVRAAFINQFRLKVLTEGAVPLLRNYFDGSNGWYRVDYAGRNGDGIPPFGLSRALLENDWGTFVRDDRQVRDAFRTMWRALASPTGDQCKVLSSVYLENSFWRDRKSVPTPLSGGAAGLSLLPLLATTPDSEEFAPN